MCVFPPVSRARDFHWPLSARKFQVLQRQGLMDMLDAINPTIHAIIATEADRLSRDVFQYGWLSTHRAIKGVRILLINECQAITPAERAFASIITSASNSNVNPAPGRAHETPLFLPCDPGIQRAAASRANGLCAEKNSDAATSASPYHEWRKAFHTRDRKIDSLYCISILNDARLARKRYILR
jgi:hypothetical protein